MRKFLQTVAFLCCFSGFSAECFATSLDELYRDVIRSDNNDYLPLFVKNRKAPMVVLEEDDLSEVKPKDKERVEYKSEVLKLTSTVDEKAQLMKERQLQWLRTIDAVKTNQVTAIELDDITSSCPLAAIDSLVILDAHQVLTHSSQVTIEVVGCNYHLIVLREAACRILHYGEGFWEYLLEALLNLIVNTLCCIINIL